MNHDMDRAWPPLPAHRKFEDLVSRFYQRAGRDTPYFECDGETPIAFEAMVGDVKLSVGYDPAAAADARLFVYCLLGTIPPHQDGEVLRRLLELNFALAREHNASYCIESRTQNVACYLRMNLDQVDVDALRDDMMRMARWSEQWRESHFLHDADVEPGSDKRLVAGPWKASHAGSAPWMA